MFAWLDGLRIRTRVVIGMSAPVLATILLAALLIGERVETARNLERVGALADLAPVLSRLVHELQRERGQSAGYINSGGENFADSLPRQRLDTNTRIAEAEKALDAFDFNTYDGQLGESALAARRRLADLDPKRHQIDGMALPVAAMAEYYTSTIMALLLTVETMELVSSDSAVTHAISGYLNLLQAKERAGRERATGVAGFGSGQFAPKALNELVGLIRAQDVFLERFRRHSDQQSVAFFDRTVSGPQVEEVARMRDIAIASPETGDVAGITGERWFEAISNKIDLMKQVEDHVGEMLQALASTKLQAAWNALLVCAGLVGIMLAVFAGLALAIVRSIAASIAGLTDVMERLAAGDTDVIVAGAERPDELGAMARAVEIFKKDALKLERLADSFQASVMEVVRGVAGSAVSMQSSAESLLQTAEQTSTRSVDVASAAEQAAANVGAIASATEELAVSARDIGQRVHESATIARDAVAEVGRVSHQMEDLVSNTQRIGDVVKLINDIAEQTNLLALNATIEAARAGDAGRGFAVVASEVKALASQTATATGEIAQQVAATQAATSNSVQAIEGIAGTIRRINEIATAIAAAVEQQVAATGEISSNVHQAADGNALVGDNINQVSQAADDTGAEARRMRSATQELSQQSARLQTEVEGFLANVRAAA